MKLTKQRLKEIIKEEYANLSEEYSGRKAYKTHGPGPAHTGGRKADLISDRGQGLGIKRAFPDFHFLARKISPEGTVSYGAWAGGNTADEAATNALGLVEKGYKILQATDQLRPELERLGLMENQTKLKEFLN